MTQVFDEGNRIVPVTVIEAGPCRVVQIKTPERDGYAAVQLAFGETKAQRLSKPELGHLKAANADPTKYLAELRRRPLRLRARPDPEGRRVRGGRAGRRDRHQQGPRFRRRDEAPQLLGPGRVARQPQEAPGAGLDRCLRDAGARVQGHEDGRASSATCARRRSTCRSSRATPSATCCSSAAPFPGLPGGIVFVRNAVKSGVKA